MKVSFSLIQRFITYTAITMLVISCGGGGSSNSPSIASPTAITVESAELISAVIINAERSARSAEDTTGLFVGASITVQPAEFKLTDFMFEFLTNAPLSNLPSADLIVGAAVGPDTYSCENFSNVANNTGIYTLSGNVAHQGGPVSIGDTVNATFYNCDLTGYGGIIANGEFRTNIVSITGDYFNFFSAPPRGLGISIQLINLSVVAGLGTYFADGNMNVDTLTTDGSSWVTEISGSNLMIATGVNTEETLYNYLITQHRIGSSYLRIFSGTLDSKVLGGSVNFDTFEPFLSLGYYGTPFTGSLIIVGSAGASITITVLNEIDLRLEVDADGDGSIDENGTISTTWDTLSSLL